MRRFEEFVVERDRGFELSGLRRVQLSGEVFSSSSSAFSSSLSPSSSPPSFSSPSSCVWTSPANAAAMVSAAAPGAIAERRAAQDERNKKREAQVRAQAVSIEGHERTIAGLNESADDKERLVKEKEDDAERLVKERKDDAERLVKEKEGMQGERDAAEADLRRQIDILKQEMSKVVEEQEVHFIATTKSLQLTSSQQTKMLEEKEEAIERNQKEFKDLQGRASRAHAKFEADMRRGEEVVLVVSRGTVGTGVLGSALVHPPPHNEAKHLRQPGS